MNDLCKLSVLGRLKNDPVLSALEKLDKSEERFADFLSALFQKDAQDDVLGYICRQILYDDNPFSRACCRNPETVSPYITRAFVSDLKRLERLVHGKDIGNACAAGEEPPLFAGWNEETARRLSAYYFKNGYGIYAQYRAFRYSQGVLLPILSPSTVTLRDLKGYDREQKEVRDNFENFIMELPFSDMLLYGDRGTGKSSTVHAMINLYADEKLRLVEITKEDLLSLSALKAMLAREAMKFVIFIDDFSLSEGDERVSTVKACLQGSMEGLASNVMIAATGNRRHIVEEKFDTRRNSVHAGDSEHELLSLSDRFGKTVLFSQTGKAEYLSIVRELAEDCGISAPFETLSALAERWALYGGGRSPRRARQFIDYCLACEKKGKEIDI